MEHLIDYVKWRGDIPFTSGEITPVDNVIFCTISYLKFDDVIRPEDTVSLRDLWERYLKLNPPAPKEKHLQDFIRLTKACAESVRFGSLMVRGWRSVLGEEISCQFCAMIFDLTDQASFVAFRGTDETIAGWKDDFLASVIETEAQLQAMDYVNEMCADGRQYDLGGHSKGGNLALFAALHMKENLLPKIRHIYLNDSPGLSPESTDMTRMNELISRITSVRPSFSIIGRLFDMNIPDSIITASDQEGIMQHSPVSWLVKHGHFAEEEHFEPVSLMLMDLVNSMLANTTLNEKLQLFDEVFRAVQEENPRTVADLFSNRTSVVKALHAILTGKRTVDVILNISLRSAVPRSVNYLRQSQLIQYFRSRTWAAGILAIAFGVLTILLEDIFGEWLLWGLLLGIAVFDFTLTFLALRNDRWNLINHKAQIVTSLTMILLFLVGNAYDRAFLAPLTYLLFCILMLLFGVNHFFRLMRKPKTLFCFFHLAMCLLDLVVIMGFCGPIPISSHEYFSYAGALLILEGIFLLILSFLAYRKKRF